MGNYDKDNNDDVTNMFLSNTSAYSAEIEDREKMQTVHVVTTPEADSDTIRVRVKQTYTPPEGYKLVPAEAPEDYIPPEGYKLVPDEAKTARLQILVRPSVRAKLKKSAIERQLSVNEIVNQLIENYVKTEGK